MSKYIVALILVCAIAPLAAVAQLSSENFQVEEASVGTGAVSGETASGNFSTEGERGGVFIYDGVAESAESGSITGTRVYRGVTNVSVNEVDSIQICHTATGEASAIVANARVLIALAELDPPNGYHATENDIIPPFFYDFGEGSESYPGKNWDTEGQALYANNCALFIERYQQTEMVSEQPAAQAPGINTPSLPASPAPPLQQPVAVCEGQEQAFLNTTALDDQTLLELRYDSKTVRSKVLEEQGVSDYTLLLNIFPVPADEVTRKTNTFAQFLTALSRLETTEKNNSSILKNPSEVTYVPPTSTAANETNAQAALDTIEISISDPCAEYDPLISSTLIDNLTDSTSTIDLNPVTSTEVAYVGDRFRDEDTFGWDVSPLELLTVPFEMVTLDIQGNSINTFDRPMQFEIFNPNIADLKHRLVLAMPDQDAELWFEVPFTTIDNRLRFESDVVGQFYIFVLPEQRVVVEEEEVTTASTATFDLIDRLFLGFFGLVVALLAVLLLIMFRKPKNE